MGGRKIVYTLKTLLLWCMATLYVVMRACTERGEHLGLFLVDLRSHFAEDPVLYQMFRNKVVVISLACVCLLLFGLLTEECEWKGRFFGREILVRAGSKLTRIVYDLVLVAVAVLFVPMAKQYLQPEVVSVFSESWEGDVLVAHAGGGIEEHAYTNSRDAFEASYAEGVRTIELDFLVTADDQMVCWHDWEDPINELFEENYVPLKKEFMQSRIYGKYEPLALEDVFALMKKYPDVYVVTDTKDDDLEGIKRDFEVIVRTAEITDSMEVLDRLVVQLYNHRMYEYVETVHHFPNYILTLYQLGGHSGADFVKHCRFCKNHGIRVITMWASWATSENVAIAEQYDIDIYVHTVNKVEQLEEKQAVGVKGFYTDYIFPQMLY
ncbi:MAG: hypothetical protein IJ747_03250 [Lachnospiraceae bacterium]|nr:hypothetical protein [Lachnospiraceae bacterium]